MSAYETLFPDIYLECDQAPDLLVEGMIARTVEDFCERTRCWNIIAEHVVTADASVQTLVPPADSILVEVLSAKYNGSDLATPGKDQVDLDDFFDIPGTPGAIFLGDADNTVELVPAPMTAGTLRYRVALKPTLTAVAAPDHIFRHYREALVNGVLARLFIVREKPWTSLTKASAHAAAYEAQIAKYTVTEADGRRRGTKRVTAYGGI